jgi:hypothetical protein
MDSGILTPSIGVASTGFAGFIFLRAWFGTRMLHRLEPGRIYGFWVGTAGFALTLLSLVLILLLEQARIILTHLHQAPEGVRLTLDLRALQPSMVQWWLTILLSPALATVALGLDRWPFSSRFADGILERDLERSAFGQLAMRALEAEKPMALTLDTGHVVIGHPTGLQSFASVSSDVDVLPFASGYRSETHDLVLTTSYQWIYGLAEAERRSFVKAIHRDRIVSANLFDQKRFLQFRNQPRSSSGV